ncbi:MAG: hypothetical protein JOZ19_01970 [Rubrobacter sp.]|nr:hypothetical protein [Rubrobacter sp.]
MKPIEKRACSVRSVLGRLSRWQARPVKVRGSASEAVHTFGCLGWEQLEAQEEPEAVARGVIRREEIPLLTHYGTAYGLFDECSADYECVLTSDAYRLGEYVGDSVRVSGSLTKVIGGMPVMEVTHLQLLKMKWMR